MIPCNGIHILPARSEPVAEAMRVRAGERRLSRRRGDTTHGECRTTALGDPAREAPSGERRSDGDYWKPSSAAVRRAGPV